MPKTDLLIDGQRLPGERTQIKSPYDGRVVGEVGFADAAQVEQAIAVAQRAAPAMAAVPRHERVAILERIAAGLRERTEELGRLISDEAGKPIAYARAEADRAAQTFLAAADACKQGGGELVAVDAVAGGAGRQGLVRRFPLGAVAGISPFNFPLNLSAHKVAPAIAAGCTMVLKPASQTPMSGLALGEVALQAGLPPGALNVVPAQRAAADQLVSDDRLKLLTFTGSAEVGWAMKARAGRKRVVLELGGNAAAIVGPDADLQQVIPRLVVGAFAYAGQICISVQRIFVVGPLAQRFLPEFVAATEARARWGDPADEGVVCGPMIDAWNVERTVAWIEEARQGGAQVLCGGRAEGRCVLPTVITGTDPGMKVVCEEAFAPLVVVEAVQSFEEAIARTNRSRFGLQCAVFTHHLPSLFKCYDEIEVGGVIHNDTSLFRVDHMPYGGVKDSGLGREGPRYAMEEMTEPRLLVLNP